MTKDEAITALRHGEKVTHSYFMPGEYIYIGASGELCDESGLCLPSANFWRLRHGEMWVTGWDIYIESQDLTTDTQRQRSYETSARIAFWALVSLLMLLTYICITY